MPAMNKLAPFLWFNDNAEEAAAFYLGVFPHARKLDEVRSQGVGPWPVGTIATITIEIEGQEMVFLNGGPAQQLNPAISFFVRCDSQEEIDTYWDKLIEGGKPMACGWLTDRFGLCWQIVPRHIGALISHPKAMQAMMGMIKMDLSALEAAARDNGWPLQPTEYSRFKWKISEGAGGFNPLKNGGIYMAFRPGPLSVFQKLSEVQLQFLQDVETPRFVTGHDF